MFKRKKHFVLTIKIIITSCEAEVNFMFLIIKTRLGEIEFGKIFVLPFTMRELNFLFRYFDLKFLLIDFIFSFLKANLLFGHTDEAPQPDSEIDHHEVKHAKAKRNSSKSRCPRFKPPCHCLWTSISVSVT